MRRRIENSLLRSVDNVSLLIQMSVFCCMRRHIDPCALSLLDIVLLSVSGLVLEGKGVVWYNRMNFTKIALLHTFVDAYTKILIKYATTVILVLYCLINLHLLVHVHVEHVRRDVHVNECKRLSNITLRHKFRFIRSRAFIVILHFTGSSSTLSITHTFKWNLKWNSPYLHLACSLDVLLR